jgi:hypothetical protein
MEGRPPLGYDAVDRKLLINPVEAETVRDIFRRYLELGSVVRLVGDLTGAAIESKRWLSRRGEMLGGGALGRGALYHLLVNEVYPHWDAGDAQRVSRPSNSRISGTILGAMSALEIQRDWVVDAAGIEPATLRV